MAMISLVYVSFASHELSDEELKDILEVSRRNNKPDGVTGMLLYRDGFFIQALEGEESVVRPLYEKIKQDDRHKNVLLVTESKINSRSFNDWSMGFNKLSDEDVEQLPGFTDFLQEQKDLSYFTDHPSRATMLLDSFKNRTYF